MLATARNLIFALLLVASSTQEAAPDIHGQNAAGDVVQIDGPVLAEEAKQEEKVRQALPKFIIEEFRELHKFRETFREADSFLISVPPGGTYDFRYKIQSNSNPCMIIKIFTHENGDDIAILKQHDIDDYLQISSSTKLFGNFEPTIKAYARKFVSFGSHSGAELFVRFQSKFEREVIVEVHLSGPPLKIDRDAIATNDNFTVVTKKLQAIRDQMKEVEDNNRFNFKFQWGFLEREEHYEQEMLKLTGVEAFVILATSVVQIYCIKSLFESKAIV